MDGKVRLTYTRPNIFLTSFFRSGSSHVKETLLRLLPGYRQATTVYSAGKIGNDSCKIDLTAGQVLMPIPCQVFHQHTLGTAGNVRILETFHLKPIVQMRNMLDSMVSVRELLATGVDQHLGIYYPHQFAEMSDTDQLWWCVKNLPNWYFTFYLSWKYAEVDCHFLWYDEYYKDQVVGVRKILDHVGLSELGSVSDEGIRMAAEVIDPTMSRFKFGRPGRGREILSTNMVDDIKAQATVWPEGYEMVQQLIERGYDD